MAGRFVGIRSVRFASHATFALGLALLLVTAGTASTQTNEMDLDDVLDAAQQFAQENLDPSVLQALKASIAKRCRTFSNTIRIICRGIMCWTPPS